MSSRPPLADPASPAAPPSDPSALAARIDALLPQTQCMQCGYDGCRPYAEAIARAQADINRCPPGGTANVVRLSRLTGRPARPIDPACGVEGPRRMAWIDPSRCIGCTRCLPACPVDAILGAPKFLHAVLTSACTGCRLCLAPCPVDCIEMRAIDGDDGWTDAQAADARRRFDRHRSRHPTRVVPVAAAAHSEAGTVDPVAPVAQPAAVARAGEAAPAAAAPAAAEDADAGAPAPAAPGVAAPVAAADGAAAAERKRALLAAITERARRNLAQRRSP